MDEIVQKPRWIEDDREKLSGIETILLVEDEEVVRNLVRDILTDKGYNVLETDSGKEAIAICGTYSGPIHLLFSDVIMPNISGTELRDQLINLRPDIKVLFMSGYTDESISHSGILDSDSSFIEKPFTPDALARKVREVIES